MKFTRRSASVFGTVLIFVIFLGGFRLGRVVEKSDKSYVAPTKIPTATPAETPTIPPLKLKTFTHPCGVSFSYPASLQESKKASMSALLQDNTQSISITCTKIGSDSAKITSIVDAITPFPEPKDGSMTWSIKNTKTREIISFNVSQNLFELVLQTLKLQ